MTEQTIFSIDIKDVKYRSRYVDNYKISIIDEEKAQQKKVEYDQWSEADENVDDSDNDSDFGEEVHPIRSYDDENFDENDEFHSRMLTCLKELEKLKTNEGQHVQDCEAKEIEEYDDDFDVDSAQDIRQLLANYEKRNESQIRKKVVHKPLTSKYSELPNPYHMKMLIRKPKRFAELDTIYVAFLHSFGCCSSSQRPKRIFHSRDGAINYAKKLHNFAQVAFYKSHGGHGNETPSCPEIFLFSRDRDGSFTKGTEIRGFLQNKYE